MSSADDTRALLARHLARPRELVRKLVIGEAIGERPRRQLVRRRAVAPSPESGQQD